MSLVHSFKVASSDSVASQRIVYISAADTVAIASGVTVGNIGVSVDKGEGGYRVPIQVNGIAKIYFNDSVAAGARVVSDGSGRAVAYSQITGTSYFLGYLVSTKVEATGTIAQVLIQPGSETKV